MDDPLFDPWCLGEQAGADTPHRWRSRVAAPPTPPVSAPKQPKTLIPSARLPGTPGFLRTMAAPRLQEVARRLSMARHEVRFEDRLGTLPAVLRLTLDPWHGPWGGAEDVDGAFELSIETTDEEWVVASYRIRGGSGLASGQDRITADKVNGAWIDARVVAFIDLVFGRA